MRKLGDQMGMFDGEGPSDAARRARDEAMARAEAHAPEDWNARADAAILRLAKAREQFTTDALWDRLDPPPEPRALGPAMKRAQKAGWIEPTDRYKQSAREANHARPVRVWRSKVYLNGE